MSGCAVGADDLDGPPRRGVDVLAPDLLESRHRRRMQCSGGAEQRALLAERDTRNRLHRAPDAPEIGLAEPDHRVLRRIVACEGRADTGGGHTGFDGSEGAGEHLRRIELRALQRDQGDGLPGHERPIVGVEDRRPVGAIVAVRERFPGTELPVQDGGLPPYLPVGIRLGENDRGLILDAPIADLPAMVECAADLLVVDQVGRDRELGRAAHAIEHGGDRRACRGRIVGERRGSGGIALLQRGRERP